MKITEQDTMTKNPSCISAEHFESILTNIKKEVSEAEERLFQEYGKALDNDKTQSLRARTARKTQTEP